MARFDTRIEVTPDGNWAWTVYYQAPFTRGLIRIGEGNEPDLGLALTSMSLCILRKKAATR